MDICGVFLSSKKLFFVRVACSHNFQILLTNRSPGDSDEDSDDDDDDDDESGEDFDSDELDDLDDNKSFASEETKSRFTNYSLTSSVIRRNEGLTLLDDRFEKVT